MRALLVMLILSVLTACTSRAQAPVSTRDRVPVTQTTVSQPGGAVVTRPAAPAYRPTTRPATNQYTVRRGDTLYSVAWQHGLTVGELAQQNRIQPPYTIYPGQSLQVSPPTRAVAPVRIQPLPGNQPQETVSAAPDVKPAPQAVRKPAKKPAPRPVTPAAKPAPVAPVPARATSPVAALYDGKWVWPTRGRVLRGFQPKSNGKKGIDIGGHHAQPVKAAAGGRVVYAGSGLVGYGRLIIVKHNENLLSAYGHNSKLLVAEGDQVKAGDMIAKMGNSGTDRTALYFEIRKDGKPVNPMQYLPRN